MVQITKDNAYDAVGAGRFSRDAGGRALWPRSTAFDKIISATHDHFWDPLDKKYIDFDQPFDLTTRDDPARRTSSRSSTPASATR